MSDLPSATILRFPGRLPTACQQGEGCHLHPLWRNPRQFRCGVFIMETQDHSFQSGFHWFANESDLLHWLCGGFWDVYREVRASFASGYHPDREHFRRTLRSARALSPELLQRLDAYQDTQVLWWGVLPDLASAIEQDIMLRTFFGDYIRERSNQRRPEKDIDGLIAVAEQICIRTPQVQEAWASLREKSGSVG